MEPAQPVQSEASPAASSYGFCPALRESLLPSYVDVAAARKTHVMRAPGLLTSADLALIADVRAAVLASEDEGTNNPQNKEHDRKVCTFLNRDPCNLVRKMAPRVLAKLLRFADRAWVEALWSGDAARPGPLHRVAGGVRSLSIRVVEHWEYSVGGALVDPWHYDDNSVVTIVGLLCDGFEGGVFRTHEPDGEHLEHPMAVGDVICFVSHKYHNVTPVTAGARRSIVMELWEGGLAFAGRRPPPAQSDATRKPD